MTRILYVEDDALLRSTVAELFESEGWRVSVCGDGIKAWAEIEGGEPYDLILLDNALPGVRGIRLVRHVRSLAHRKRTPVVVFSASECGREARGAGANEFLKKPEDMDVLVETVRRVLGVGGRGALV